MKLLVRYRDMLMSTMVQTTVSAWSLPNRALNISFTEATCILPVSFSFMKMQQMISVITKITATARAT